MLGPIAESPQWILALAMVALAVGGRVRAGRRRERLNRALHELRRPLQALTLAVPAKAVPAKDGERWGQLDLAIAALAELDRELNGGRTAHRSRIIDARGIVADAVERWRPAAACAGRRLELRWRADGSRVDCDPVAIARALDNLIANAIQHGGGSIGVEATSRGGHLRLFVVDGVRVADIPSAISVGPRAPRLGGSAFRWRSDPRHGHGLRSVAEVAAEHGGRFAACRHGTGACAVIELPLAGPMSG